MLPLERGRAGRTSPWLTTVAAVVGAVALAGCTRSNIIDSSLPAPQTPTTVEVRPVPNGGPELPDVTTTTSPAHGSATTTTAAPTGTTAPPKSSSAAAKKASKTSIPPPSNAAVAAASATRTADQATTTTTAPTPSTTTTTVIGANPSTIQATATPALAFPGSTQTIQVQLAPGQDGPTPTVASCTGIDYQLSSTGYVLAPFQTALSCPSDGTIVRTLPADVPTGQYDLCVAITADTPTTVCTPYFVVAYPTS